jgi:hypothetical protein
MNSNLFTFTGLTNGQSSSYLLSLQTPQRDNAAGKNNKELKNATALKMLSSFLKPNSSF